MRLTRVDIHGFKSFADRTPLDLPPGLTAIVGPNGCGKSNVIDAIKWALGEQKASALRGKEMVDVVFKGNGARQQRNFAEVSLHFDNEDGVLTTEYTEVVITRRLFRTGESEYLINRQPVRLKDVRDLLMDTGLGTGAYSVMEQGRIDAILSANAVERRRIFEEAAGISRYRQRRRESESKLSRTEQNLLRLSDVVEELEKRQRSLKVQAGRARSFLEARDRVRFLRSRYYVHQWETLGTTLVDQQQQLEALEVAEAEARATLEAARAEVSALTERQSGVRGEVDESAESFRQASGEVEAVGERQAALRERITEAGQAAERLATRISGLSAALEERRKEAEDILRRVDELKAEAARWQESVAQAEAARAAAEADVAAWEEDTRQRRDEALSRLARLTEVRNRVGQAASRHAALGASIERLGEQIEGLSTEVKTQADLQGELFAGARELDTSHDAVAALAAEHDQRLQTLRGEHAAADDQLARTREELAGADSRKEALDELIARRDGVSPGALCLLEAELEGVDGLLVDHLRAPRALAEAVEAALGSSTQAVLTADRTAALAALAHLSQEGAGRVQLVPRDGLQARGVAAGGRRLLDELEVTAHHEVFEALLGHVRLVDDRDALASCVTDGATVWVTPAGELLDDRGVLRGGASGQESGLLSRRAERDDLVTRCAELQALIDEALAARTTRIAELESVAEVLAGEQERLRAIDTERERTRVREREASDRKDALQREVTLKQEDLTRLKAEAQTAATALQAARADEGALEAEVAADRQTETSEEARHRELAETVSARQEELSAARLELSTRNERVEALDSEHRQVQRGLEERRADLGHAEEERDGSLSRATHMQEQLEQLEERASSLVEERDRRAGLLGEAKQRSSVLGEHIDKAAGLVTEREQAHEHGAESLSNHKLASHETSIRRDELRSKVLEELEVDLEEGLPELEAEEGAEPLEWDAVAAEIEQLKARLGRMANVNLAAVDELTEVEERLTFLTGQRDDLTDARQALMDTIARLNKESRERFVATFDEVRGHFRQIFRKLFRGGKADMVLEEGEDVLEAGIEITAAPPGKDPRTITLLSGGERTLTAVGLLFSLFKARPSPVCLLDEVDAALDETNIERFCSVLEDFLGQSQFLVVTHARRTMSYADQVFGVTMAEHGVSKVLSLTVDEYEKDGLPSPHRPGGARPEVRAAIDAPAPAEPGRVVEGAAEAEA
jgi:chromosome segregation protein